MVKSLILLIITTIIVTLILLFLPSMYDFMIDLILKYHNDHHIVNLSCPHHVNKYATVFAAHGIVNGSFYALKTSL